MLVVIVGVIITLAINVIQSVVTLVALIPATPRRLATDPEPTAPGYRTVLSGGTGGTSGPRPGWKRRAPSRAVSHGRRVPVGRPSTTPTTTASWSWVPSTGASACSKPHRTPPFPGSTASTASPRSTTWP